MDNDNENLRKLYWHNAIAFTIFWLMVYICIAVPQCERLPAVLTIRDEDHDASTQFIGERAGGVLRAITNVGARMIGSEANEIITIEVLKAEVEYIKSQMSRKLKQQLDVDVQLANGNFSIDGQIHSYNNIQNFILKLSPTKLSATTKSGSLLINSHFDTAPQSAGAGDAGSMVAVMLEVLRVLAKSHEPLEHAVVFLFNGAAEAGWLGAHAFVTKHEWAKDCKAFINLDSAGWGGQLLLFQAAASQSLLLQNYKADAPQPFASSLFEDLFQADFLLSNSDFRIFRKFGNISGFDMALISNGYVHHTKFDRPAHYANVMHYSSMQFAGDNVLALTRALLRDLKKFDDKALGEADKMIYYDFFGYFLLLYSLQFGALLNFAICIIAGAAICLSLYEYGAYFGLDFKSVLSQYALTMIIQIFSLIIGAAVTILISASLSASNCSLCWYSNKWLLMGLYFCPMFFGMLGLPALTIKYIDGKCNCLLQHVRLLMHAHCTWLLVLTLILTICGVRSAYLSMIAVAFYALAAWTNFCAELRTGSGASDYWFLVPIIVSQIVPFIYFTTLTHNLFKFLVPLMGRIGYKFNAELLMASIAIVMSSLFAGFLMPIFLILQKSLKIAFVFLTCTLFCLVLAFTPLGAPFRAETAPQRFEVVHEIHKFNNPHWETSTQSVIRVQTFDPSIQNLNDFKKIFTWNREFFYMLDSASTSFANRFLNFRIPITHAPSIPKSRYPKLLVRKRSRNASNASILHKFYFRLIGPNYMKAKIILTNAKIVGWPFEKVGGKFPLNINFVAGRYKKPYDFDITFKVSQPNQTNASLSGSYFEIGIESQWYDEQKKYNEKFRDFIDAFPVYAFVNDYQATYEQWKFELS